MHAFILSCFERETDGAALELLVSYLKNPSSWTKIPRTQAALWEKLFSFVRRVGRNHDPSLCGFVLLIIAAAPNAAAFGELKLFSQSLFASFWDAMENATVHAHVAQLLADLIDGLLLLLSRHGSETGVLISGSLLPKLVTSSVCAKIPRARLVTVFSPILVRLARDPGLAPLFWDACVASLKSAPDMEAFVTLCADLDPGTACQGRRVAFRALLERAASDASTLPLCTFLLREQGPDFRETDSVWQSMIGALRASGPSSIAEPWAGALSVELARRQWENRLPVVLELCKGSPLFLEQILGSLEEEDHQAVCSTALDDLVLMAPRTAVAACLGSRRPMLTKSGVERAIRASLSWPELGAALTRNPSVPKSGTACASAFCEGLIGMDEMHGVDNDLFLDECVVVLQKKVKMCRERDSVVVDLQHLGKIWERLIKIPSVGLEVVSSRWPFAGLAHPRGRLGLAGFKDEHCFLVFGGGGGGGATTLINGEDFAPTLCQAAVALETIALLLSQGTVMGTILQDTLVRCFCWGTFAGWLPLSAGNPSLMAREEDLCGFHPGSVSRPHLFLIGACHRVADCLFGIESTQFQGGVPRALGLCQTFLDDRDLGPLAAAFLSPLQKERFAMVARHGFAIHQRLHRFLASRPLRDSATGKLLFAHCCRIGDIRTAAIVARQLGPDPAWVVGQLRSLQVTSWAVLETASTLCDLLLRVVWSGSSSEVSLIPDLVSLLQHRVWSVQAASAQALERLSSVCSAAVHGPLVKAAGDPNLDPWSRLMTWFSLLHSGPTDNILVTLEQFDLFAADVFQMVGDGLPSSTRLDQTLELSSIAPDQAHDRALLAGHLWFEAVSCFRVSAREWFRDLRDKQLSSVVQKFTEKFVSPWIVSVEVAAAGASAIPGVTLRCGAGNYVEASLSKDDLTLQLRFVFPR